MTADALRDKTIEIAEGALVAGLPEGANVNAPRWRGAGVFLPDGRADPRLAPMQAPEPLGPGRRRGPAEGPPEAIFCGRSRAHFGHFLAEGTGRLWAVSRLGPRLPLLWFSDRQDARARSRTREALLALLGIANPVRIESGVSRVGRLHLPATLHDPLHGIPADPAFQAWIESRLPPPPPPGPDLYISRSRLGDASGRFLGEAAIEEGLVAQGYRVLYPEELPLADQVAACRAARRVVMAEGSPLHLLALLDSPGQRVAVIRRRPRTVASIPPMLDSFRRGGACVVNRIARVWADRPDAKILFRAVSEIDIAPVWRDLAAEGFISGAGGMPVPGAAGIEAERLARAADRPFIQPTG